MWTVMEVRAGLGGEVSLVVKGAWSEMRGGLSGKGRPKGEGGRLKR